MSLARRLYSGNPGFDFRPSWRRQGVVSAVLVVVCVASFFVRGLDRGIDFEGGGVWEVPTEDLSVEDARDALRGSGNDGARIQVVTTAAGARSIKVQAGVEAVGESDAIVTALADAAGTERSQVSVNTVGPSWGDSVTDAAIRALLYFFVAITAYLWIRLEWKMAIGSFAAVIHTIVLTVGTYSIFQFEITPATVIAFLTILGYSLYDTVIVFDKLRSSAAFVGVQNRLTYTDVANYATNEVLMRSVNTSLVATLPVLSMLVVGSWMLGATTLEEFAIALTIGQIVGAYSTLYVAVPVVLLLKEREAHNREVRERLGGHRDEVVDVLAGSVRPTGTGDDAGRGPVGRSKGQDAARPVVAPAVVTHPPRPRKKGKKR